MHREDRWETFCRGLRIGRHRIAEARTPSLVHPAATIIAIDSSPAFATACSFRKLGVVELEHHRAVPFSLPATRRARRFAPRSLLRLKTSNPLLPNRNYQVPTIGRPRRKSSLLESR